MYNTLTIGVYGMIEGKKIEKSKKGKNHDDVTGG